MKTVEDELEEIRSKFGGVLYPHEVVNYARNESAALHGMFEWDDTVASENYRVWQARKLIKVFVRVLPSNAIEYPVYVSLKQDRYNYAEDGDSLRGGYRSTIDVMSTPSLRKTLLEEAFEEIEKLEKKYQAIKELADVFAAARTAKQKLALMADAMAPVG